MFHLRFTSSRPLTTISSAGNMAATPSASSVAFVPSAFYDCSVCHGRAPNRPFSKMAAENSNKSKLKTNTSARKTTLTLVTLSSFSISGEISAEKMYVENWKIYRRLNDWGYASVFTIHTYGEIKGAYTECKYGGPLGRRPGRVEWKRG